jgi:hypothetical protein
MNVAIDATGVEVKHGVVMCCGFESDGAVNLSGSTIGGNLFFAGGRFLNPDNIAISVSVARIGGNVFLALEPLGAFYSDGAVEFVAAHVAGVFSTSGGTFAGKGTERHGLFASLLEVNGGFGWLNVDMENVATLDLTGASVTGFADDQRSWPQPGKLLIDGFTYKDIGPVKDPPSRLRWVALQPEFHPQPYRQLAKVLHESGDDAGAVGVLIAEEDARYQKSYLPRRLLAGFLKTTIGYGHRPLLALLWSLGVVLVGWLVVYVGKRAGVMRPTYPENAPPSETPLRTPLSFSLFARCISAVREPAPGALFLAKLGREG